jgi:iron complex transport system substrate-binding protein
MKHFGFRPLSAAVAILVFCGVWLAGCAQSAAPPPTAPAATEQPPAPTATAPLPATTTFTDDLGRVVPLPGAPSRIVSLAPSATEILFAVGAGEQVVGVTKFCNYLAEATSRTPIGGFSASSISIETIISLQPDLVIAGSASQRPVVEALEQQDIPVIAFAPASFEDVYRTIATLGSVTGHPEQAAQVVTEMRERVDAVVAKVQTVPEEQRPTVFWEVFDEPLTTTGPNTFIGQLITLAGASNIFADVAEDYPQISVEEVVVRNPAVILGPNAHSDKLSAAILAQRPGWAQIDAVASQRVYLFDGDIVSRPGPRLADALEIIAAQLYPEIFA